MKQEELPHNISDTPKKCRGFGKRIIVGVIVVCVVVIFGLGYMTDVWQRSPGLGMGQASKAVTEPYTAEAQTGAYAEENTEDAVAEAYTEDTDAALEPLAGSAQYSTENQSDGAARPITAPDASPSENGIVEENGTINTEKLVYTGNLTIQTKDYAASKAAIRKQIQSLNGIIESETETDSNYNWYNYEEADSEDDARSGYLNWDITARIPTESYQSFLNTVGENGKVLYKSSNVENITKQYHDTSARIEALETQQKKLQDMMEQASTVEDMIAIESRLSDVEYELNSYKSSLAEMDSDVAYSTVYLTLEEVAAYSSRAKEDASLGERIAEAFQNSLHYFVKGLETIFFALIYILPFAVVLTMVILLVRWIRKRRKSK